jgi:hypothetical protein
VKHFYGFQFALGGIFSIRGVDFERINGFPNYWAWGGEDNLINERAKQFGLTIDRSNFYSIGDSHILQFADGMKRLICRDELATSIMPNNTDGISKLTNVAYIKYDDTHMVDVNSFDTYIHYSQLHFEEQSLDKVNKIRVSPLNALRNIKQLQSEYIVDANKQIHSIHASAASAASVAGQLANSHLMRKVNGGVNTVNMPIQPNIPFMMNHNMMIGDRNPRQNIGLAIPQDRTIITEEERHRRIAEATVTNGRLYQNVKEKPDIIIKQHPASGLRGHRRFGMRALFM